MWKKPEEQSVAPNVSANQQNAGARPERNDRSNVAIIGQSICIKGEVTGAEDLIVEGSVEGMIDLKQNAVTIGKGGRVKANIFGKVIQVHGEVVGDLTASEQIVIHESGTVRGNVSGPRVALKDGARLKGAINTDADAAKQALKTSEASAKASLNGSKSHLPSSSHAVV
ncbi:MAG: polymer-forming cytoskeletal protein [Deltaproteobacteria bacterium]|nr:polymer-forming cytoskeletal protein [Deltaproteobacteria bacterium]